MCPSPFYGYTGHGRLTYRKISDSPVSGAVNRIVIRYPVSRQVTKTGRGGNREEGLYSLFSSNTKEYFCVFRELFTRPDKIFYSSVIPED
jgi:hypothetical protein